MARRAEITFRAAAWGPAVEGWIGLIDGIGRYKPIIREAVEGGEMQALEILADGQPVGALVWSVERERAGAVVVVNALAARPVPGVDVTRAALAFVTACGRGVGAVALRFWTDRPGLVRKCERAGMRKTYVMEGRF